MASCRFDEGRTGLEGSDKEGEVASGCDLSVGSALARFGCGTNVVSGEKGRRRNFLVPAGFGGGESGLASEVVDSRDDGPDGNKIVEGLRVAYNFANCQLLTPELDVLTGFTWTGLHLSQETQIKLPLQLSYQPRK